VEIKPDNYNNEIKTNDLKESNYNNCEKIKIKLEFQQNNSNDEESNNLDLHINENLKKQICELNSLEDKFEYVEIKPDSGDKNFNNEVEVLMNEIRDSNYRIANFENNNEKALIN